MKSFLILAFSFLAIGGGYLLAAQPSHVLKGAVSAKSESLYRAKAKVTFANDIAPIVFSKCTSCHREGEGAPFPLETYAQVRHRASLIARVTKEKLMPPWKAAPGDVPFLDDRHLTDQQIEKFQAWASDGLTEGTPSAIPAMPKFTKGWQLGTPDLIAKMPKAFNVPADGPDIYRNFTVPLHLTEDVYVRAIDFRPSAKTVVHHSLFAFDTSGTAAGFEGEGGKPGFEGGMAIERIAQKVGGNGIFVFMDSGGKSAPRAYGGLGMWAVGAQPGELPNGLGYYLPKGSDLVLSTHFHPSGKAETEQSTVGLYFTKVPPKEEFTGILLPPLFAVASNLNIPAGDAHYTLKDSFVLPVDCKAFSAAAHAHYLGKTCKLTAVLPNGDKKVLLDIPNWDFNWQGEYRFAHSFALPAGTRLDSEITYDNSSNNINNPKNPPVNVTWGEQTTDEMGSMILNLTASSPDDLAKLKQANIKHIRDTFRAMMARR